MKKFYYLHSSLKGEAIQILKNVELSNDNYPIAWNLLSERFENKRLIEHNHFKSLRKVLDNVQKDLRALKSLGEAVETCDTFIRKEKV